MESGTVLSINICAEKGKKKCPVESAFISSQGIEGDAHRGDWDRQVSLLAEESLPKKDGFPAFFSGDFAENTLTRNIDLKELKIGQQLRVGESVLEITQIGKKCHEGCEIKKHTGDCVMQREGIFAKVIKPGNVKTLDKLEIIS